MTTHIGYRLLVTQSGDNALDVSKVLRWSVEPRKHGTNLFDSYDVVAYYNAKGEAFICATYDYPEDARAAFNGLITAIIGNDVPGFTWQVGGA